MNRANRAAQHFIGNALEDKAISAALKCLQNVLLIVKRSQNQDFGVNGSDMVEQVKAGFAWETNIEQHDVGAKLTEQFQRGLYASSFTHNLKIIVIREQADNPAPNDRMVIDDEDVDGVHGCFTRFLSGNYAGSG